jgi:hypothetical protein
MLAEMMHITTDSLAVALIFGTPIVAILAGVWYKIEQVRSENELKRSMIERGMSVEEIERVLSIRASGRAAKRA